MMIFSVSHTPLIFRCCCIRSVCCCICCCSFWLNSGSAMTSLQSIIHDYIIVYIGIHNVTMMDVAVMCVITQYVHVLVLLSADSITISTSAKVCVVVVMISSFFSHRIYRCLIVLFYCQYSLFHMSLLDYTIALDYTIVTGLLWITLDSSDGKFNS